MSLPEATLVALAQNSRTASWAASAVHENPSMSRGSALFRSLRNKKRWDVLNRFTSALRTRRMSSFMFREMFRMLENLAALLATVLVSRHGIFPLRKPERTDRMRHARAVRCIRIEF
jgi:hypothetical protein